MLVLVLTLAAVAVTAFVMRQRWAAAAAPEQHDAASTPSSMPSSRIPGKALAEAIIQANHGLSSEEIWSRPAIEPSTAAHSARPTASAGCQQKSTHDEPGASPSAARTARCWTRGW